MEDKIEISKETLRGLYIILCGVPYSHTGAEVYDEAIPVMEEAHQEILKLGREKGFDNRGADLRK